MKFTVANWHLHAPEYWLEHNGFTIMVSPPQWAKEQGRNIALFAPPSEIVFGHYSEKQYTDIYRNVLKMRLPQIKQWIQAHESEHIILLCACHDNKFCHRYLVASLLTWLGCEQITQQPEH